MNEEMIIPDVQIPKLFNSVHKELLRAWAPTELWGHSPLLLAPSFVDHHPTPHPTSLITVDPSNLQLPSHSRGAMWGHIARHVGNFKLPLSGRGWRYRTWELQSPACGSHVLAPHCIWLGNWSPEGLEAVAGDRDWGCFGTLVRSLSTGGPALRAIQGKGCWLPLSRTCTPHAVLLHFLQHAHKHAWTIPSVQDNSVLHVGNMQTGTVTAGNSMEFPQKVKMELPFDPVILPLGMYLKKPKH